MSGNLMEGCFYLDIHDYTPCRLNLGQEAAYGFIQHTR